MRQETQLVRRLRLALLAALVLTVGGVLGLYLFGRAGQTREVTRTEPTDPAASGKDAKVVGKGFDYTVTHGDLPSFRIRGERIRSDQNDNVELEQVGLTLFRDNKAVYELFGESASYNRETRAAMITGLVRVTAANGLELHAQRLDLSPGAQSLNSVGPVSFRFADSYRGDAAELAADLATDSLALRGGVQIATEPDAPTPMSLATTRLEMDRVAGIVRAEGGVVLHHGSDTLTAQRLVCQTEADGRTLKEITARTQVEGEVRSVTAGPEGPSEALIRFSGERLSVSFVPGSKGPAAVELQGTEKGVARLESTRDGAPGAWMTAPTFSGQFADGQLNAVQGIDGVVIEEPDGKGGKRRATADRADAAFQAGKLANATLEGKVELIDPQVRANGERAYYDLTAKRAELFGQDARATSERGDLRAPHLIYNQLTGVLHADGGVKGLVRPERGRGMAGTPLARGEGPIRIESTEATWQDSPRTFFFRGAVRAWRGSSLLACEQLQGDEDNGLLSASGGVKSVWVPEPKTGGDARSTAPLEVNADGLVYHRERHTATYSGNVRVRQENRTLTCDEAIVDLDADNRAKKMLCTGNVKMDDPDANRRATGSSAEYDVDAKTLEMLGNPVELTDPIRGKATGKRLVYDVSKGNMRLFSTATDTPPTPAPPGPSPAAVKPPSPGTRPPGASS